MQKKFTLVLLALFFLAIFSLSAVASIQGEADLEWQMLELVNQERSKAGAQPLEMDSRLVELARMKSKDMIDQGYFAHTSPTYGDPFQMMSNFGVTYMAAGENLAGNPSLPGAHTSLMDSPGHRANILNGEFTHIGIGVVQGGQYGMMVTQLFMKPAGSASPIEPPVSTPEPETEPSQQPDSWEQFPPVTQSPKPEKPKESQKPIPADKPGKDSLASKDIQVFIKGKQVIFPDIKPFINQEDRVLIPLRFLSQDMGYQVSWEGEKQKVSITDQLKRISLQINSRRLMVNGASVESDSMPILYGNRTMVPLRLILEIFDNQITWVSSLNQVHIQ